ncbi:2og-fe oxygenase superfamily protein, partial [Colletotrichum sojae]
AGGAPPPAAPEAPHELPTPAQPAANNLDTIEGWSDRKSFEDDLCSALDNIKGTGSFASFLTTSYLSYPAVRLEPGLSVRDVGPITFPLGEAQARSLIAAARQAPYGRGSETIVDTSVRNTWELDPSQFDPSPNWPDIINRMSSKLAQDMGIDVPVVADLYKLLIYEKGAMFKAHTDTEKIPGMFGTFVVCLPCPHEGGDVVVKHRGRTKTFKTSEHPRGSFVAWYSDVSHEVLPVTSGYRVVLTYNLAVDPATPRPSASVGTADCQRLRHTLQRWLSRGVAGENDRMDHVYYRLDHEYTEANISLTALKSRDFSLVQKLGDLSAELEFDVFLAAFERMEMGPPEWEYDPDDSGGDDGEGWHEIEDVLQQEDGVKGPTATHWYRVTAIGFLENRRFQGGHALEDCRGLVTGFLIDNIWKHGCGSHSRLTFQEVWKSVCQLSSDVMLPRDDLLKLLKMAVRDQPTLFEAMAADPHGVVPGDFYEWLGRRMAQGESELAEIKSGLTTLILGLGCPKFFMRHQMIEKLFPGDSPLLTDEIREWILEILLKGLEASSASGSLVGVDGKAAVAAVPLIEKHLAIPAFAIEVLYALFHFTKLKVFPVQEGVQVYRRLAKASIAALDFKIVYGPKSDEDKKRATAAPATYRHIRPDPAYNPHLAVEPEKLAIFFSNLIKMSSLPTEDLVLPLALKLVGHAPSMKSADFHTLWLPFLKHLIVVLEAHNIPLSTTRYQQIAGAILEAYRDVCVGPRPKMEVSQGRTLRCACADCNDLDIFLAKPAEREIRFPVSKQRRHHLHLQIDGNRIDCSHVTDRAGRRQRLVVTKRRPNEDMLWLERRKLAEEKFRELDQTKLGLLLGEDYPRIAEGLWPRAGNAASGSSRSVPALQPQPQPQPRPQPGPSAVPAPRPAQAAPASRAHPVPGTTSRAKPGPSYGSLPGVMPGSMPMPLIPGPMPSASRPALGSGSMQAAGPSSATPVGPSMGTFRTVSGGNIPPSVAGTKRKAEPEVIGLT